MANPISVTSVRERAFQLCVSLDQTKWDIKDLKAKGSDVSDLHKAFHQHILKATAEHQTMWNQLTENNDPTGEKLHALSHLDRKLQRLRSKYSAQPAPTQPAIPPRIVPQNVCVQNLGASVQCPQSPPLLARDNVSFKISAGPVQAPEQPQPAAVPVSTTLNRISYLLRNNNEAQALEECKTLPDGVKLAVFGALWVVCGKPMPGHPMHHDNFGEVSFFDLEPRCKSTPQQKACAVELFITQHRLYDMISLLKENKFEQAKALFSKLPEQVQGQIKASFLSPDIACAQKAEDLSQYLAAFKNSSIKIQGLVPNELVRFKGIDVAQNMTGSQKTDAKIDAIHAFATQIIKQFFGQGCRCGSPDANPSFKGFAAHYAKMHPILKPFLLQLINDLRFKGEQLESLLQQAGQDAPKSSEHKDTNLGAMTPEQRKKYNIDILEDTLLTCQNGYYINSKGEKVDLTLQHAINSLELVNGKSRGPIPNIYKETKIFLDKNKDCLSVARDCAERGLNPCLYNAANKDAPGGGVKEGASAQEEGLCRSSGLLPVLDPSLGQPKNFYPLNQGEAGDGLYAAHVPFFRGEAKQGYPYLDKPFKSAVATVAAYNFKGFSLKEHNGKLYIPDDLVEGTKEKIRTIFYMAEKHGHKSVVLIPPGCGAFETPPEHMCDLIMQVLVQEFPHSFEEIRFAIIDDHNTRKRHNPEGNIVPFERMIGYFDGPMKDVGMSFHVNN